MLNIYILNLTFLFLFLSEKLNLSVIPKYFCNPKLIVIVMHVFTDGKFQLAPIGLTNTGQQPIRMSKNFGNTINYGGGSLNQNLARLNFSD